MRKALCLFLMFVSVGAFGNIYYNYFLATQSPISDAGRWTSVATATGVSCFSDVQVDANHHIVGNQISPASPSTNCQFNDSLAFMNASGGSWDPNQCQRNTIYIGTTANSTFAEVEQFLRASIVSNPTPELRFQGYEVQFSVKASNPYWHVAPRLGSDFLGFGNPISSTALGRVLQDGDVLESCVNGSTFTIKVNGIVIGTGTDTTYATGAPGVGFYHGSDGNGHDSDWGFKDSFSYSAPTGTIRSAASMAESDVSTAYTASANGDRLLLPPGSSAWTSSLSMSKAVDMVGAGGGRIVAYAATGSPLTISTGSKTLTITGSTAITNTTPPATAALSTIPIIVGQTVRLSELGFRANFMQGTVTSWNTTTGSLTINATSSGGSCGTADANMPSNCKRWLLSTLPQSVITNNSSGTVFNLTESTAGDLSISNLKVAVGTGSTTAIQMNRTSGGKAIVLHDDWLEVKSNLFLVDSNTARGVIYNTSMDASPFTVVEAVRVKDDPNTAMPNSWLTISTMGMSDTSATAFCPDCLAGQNNFYIENSDFHAGENMTDWDSNARAVVRYNFFNNAGQGSHGDDTSTQGNRHFEIYNNVGVIQAYSDGSTANMNWWILFRGGTAAIHDNVFQNATSSDYGRVPKSDVNMQVQNLTRNAGAHPCWGQGTSGGAQHPAPRQVGMGVTDPTHSNVRTGNQNTGGTCGNTGMTGSVFSASFDGCTYVGDPEAVYIWNNHNTIGGGAVALTIGSDSNAGQCTSPDSTSNYVTAGVDYFNDGTVKPGYTAFTFPHPLAGGVVIVPSTTPAPAPAFSWRPKERTWATSR